MSVSVSFSVRAGQTKTYPEKQTAVGTNFTLARLKETRQKASADCTVSRTENWKAVDRPKFWYKCTSVKCLFQPEGRTPGGRSDTGPGRAGSISTVHRIENGDSVGRSSSSGFEPIPLFHPKKNENAKSYEVI